MKKERISDDIIGLNLYSYYKDNEYIMSRTYNKLPYFQSEKPYYFYSKNYGEVCEEDMSLILLRMDYGYNFLYDRMRFITSNTLGAIL